MVKTRSSKQKQKMEMIPPLVAKRQKARKGKELGLDENGQEVGLAENESGSIGDEYDKQRVENTRKREMLISLSEGFYTGNWELEQLLPGVGGIVESSKEDPVAIFAARIAISFLNIKRKQSNLHFVELVRVNRADMVYYLTFKASDNDFYEAKVNVNLKDVSNVFFVRPAVHYPDVNCEFLECDVPAASDKDCAPTETEI